MNSHPPSIYHDFQGLAALKHQVRQDQAGSLQQVARQFESLFVQMMVKQMRQASFGGGLFDSDRTRQYQEMYDKQLALHLSERGGLGIGEMLQRQLGGLSSSAGQTADRDLSVYHQHPVIPAVRHLAAHSLNNRSVAEPTAFAPELPSSQLDSPEVFIHSLWSAAQHAAGSIGLAPEALLAQAALETGWGGHVMPAVDGSSSHNLFGIKADQRWEGARVKRETLEFEDGVAVRRREFFRAYASFEESFRDYVAFLQSGPRYAEALTKTHDSEAYFEALQRAGYATDPNYAQKIQHVLQGPEMQQALAQLK